MGTVKSPNKNRDLLTSFKNALSGVAYAIKNERNSKFHLFIGTLVLILGIFYHISPLEFTILFLTIGLVIVCEFFNTAIEVMVDIFVKDFNPKAKIVKDVAAGAVFISAVISVLVGIFIFYDRICGTIGLKW